MYHLSRQIYRELANDIADDSQRPRVLHACEAAVHRLVTDRHYFAHPARTLFAEIRWCFPLQAQERVFAVVDRHLRRTRAYLESGTAATVALTGVRPTCRASTRKGRLCKGEPDPRTGYCAWHQHLGDGADLALTA